MPFPSLPILMNLLLGASIGLSLGLLGSGGSILTVPVLVYIVGLSVPSATVTSLLVVGANAVFGALTHWRQGTLRLHTGLTFGAAAMLGTIPGVQLNRLLTPNTVLLLFGGLMLLVGASMLRKQNTAPEAPPSRLGKRGGGLRVRLLALGLIVGLLTGFFGIGGGFLIVPALTLLAGFAPQEAVGTSLLVISLSSAAGMAGHLRAGGPDWRVAAVFILGGLAGILSGAALNRRLPAMALKRIFGVFVIGIGLYLIYRNLFG
jgi:uncharacterized membrane protein YfcA